jgi:hypothetical protein
VPAVPISSYLQAASALGSGLTAVKLRSNGLSSRYPLFFRYMAFWAVYTTLMLILSILVNPKSWVYFYAFVVGLPISWYFYVAVVFELFRLVLERHKGLYTVGRWAMYFGLAFSVAISALTFLAKIPPQKPQRSLFAMGLYMAIERGVDLSLAIFLILMLLLLNMYAVPLSRNVVLHTVIYSIFFLSGAMAMILRTVFGLPSLAATDVAAMVAPCLCVFAWFFLLTPEGEEARVKQPWFGAEQEERILAQLDSLNATLLKVARK